MSETKSLYCIELASFPLAKFWK